MSVAAREFQWIICKNGLYYRPNRQGYTSSLAEAGRYSEREAKLEAAIEPGSMYAFRESDAPAVADRTNPKDLIGQAKVDLSLFPAAGHIHGAHAMMDGADKYGPYNWREKAVKARVYVSAAQRHLLDYLDRQDEADDSGVHHLGHAIACVSIILDAFEVGNLIDDRPLRGPAPELLDRLNAKIAARRAAAKQAVIDATWAAESNRLIEEADKAEADKKARRAAAKRRTRR